MTTATRSGLPSTFSVKRSDTLEYVDCIARYVNSRSRDYFLVNRASLLAFWAGLLKKSTLMITHKIIAFDGLFHL